MGGSWLFRFCLEATFCYYGKSWRVISPTLDASGAGGQKSLFHLSKPPLPRTRPELKKIGEGVEMMMMMGGECSADAVLQERALYAAVYMEGK